MKNITLSIDEELLSQSRKYARKHDTTLNSLVRSLLSKTVQNEAENSSEYVLNTMKKANGNSGGKRWSREDLYDV